MTKYREGMYYGPWQLRKRILQQADHGHSLTSLSEIKDDILQLKNNEVGGKSATAADLIDIGPEMLAICLQT